MAFSREFPHSFAEALRVAREILGQSRELARRGVIDAEAEILVAEAYRAATGKALSRLELFARAGDRFPDKAGETLIVTAGARAQGKILQHLTGRQAFLDHEYEVGPDVLVPRPETELLVLHAIDVLRTAGSPSLGLEIGLGSGILSIELLAAFPALRMLASELTAEAEARALRNAERILGRAGKGRLTALRSPSPLAVWEAFDPALAGGRADFLVSNPPYLTRQDPIDEDVARHEPESALYAPESDALHFFRAVAQGGARRLKPGAPVVMELASERADPVLALFAAPEWEARLVLDLNGRPRVLSARLK